MNRLNLPNVAFICVHNSCRSQIAEALGNFLAFEKFNSYSAGTHIKDKINQDAVRLMKELYNIDMEKNQHSKLIKDLPIEGKIDVVITMGCNVDCPMIPCKYREDWGLIDPTNRSDDEFKIIIKEIEDNILQLKTNINNLILY